MLPQHVVKLLETEAKKPLFSLEIDTKEHIRGLAVSKHYTASAFGTGIAVHDLRTQKLIKNLENQAQSVWCNCGLDILSLPNNNNNNDDNGERVLLAGAFSLNNHIALYYQDDNNINNDNFFEQVALLVQQKSQRITDISFSPLCSSSSDRHYHLCAVGEDGFLRVWDFSTVMNDLSSMSAKASSTTPNKISPLFEKSISQKLSKAKYLPSGKEIGVIECETNSQLTIINAFTGVSVVAVQIHKDWSRNINFFPSPSPSPSSSHHRTNNNNNDSCSCVTIGSDQKMKLWELIKEEEGSGGKFLSLPSSSRTTPRSAEEPSVYIRKETTLPQISYGMKLLDSKLTKLVVLGSLSNALSYWNVTSTSFEQVLSIPNAMPGTIWCCETDLNGQYLFVSGDESSEIRVFRNPMRTIKFETRKKVLLIKEKTKSEKWKNLFGMYVPTYIVAQYIPLF